METVFSFTFSDSLLYSNRSRDLFVRFVGVRVERGEALLDDVMQRHLLLCLTADLVCLKTS